MNLAKRQKPRQKTQKRHNLRTLPVLWRRGTLADANFGSRRAVVSCWVMLAIARAMAKQCEDVPTLLGCANVTAAGRCDGCTCGGGGSFTRSGMSNLQKVTGSGAHSGQGLITIKGPLGGASPHTEERRMFECDGKQSTGVTWLLRRNLPSRPPNRKSTILQYTREPGIAKDLWCRKQSSHNWDSRFR